MYPYCTIAPEHIGISRALLYLRGVVIYTAVLAVPWGIAAGVWVLVVQVFG